MTKMKRSWLICIFLCLYSNLAADVPRQVLADSLNVFVSKYAAVHPVRVLRCGMRNGTLRVVTNEHLAAVAYKREDLNKLKKMIRRVWGVSPQVPVEIVAGGKKINDIILPDSIYRGCGVYRVEKCQHPWILRLTPYSTSGGLEGKHIALWASHGYHYDVEKDRWEWQRARLLQTVEDLFTSSFSIPYLGPMLENSGAVVVQPRERDTQREMIIVDNEHTNNGTCKSGHEWKKQKGGYTHKTGAYLTGENPFEGGTHLMTQALTNKDKASYITWQPKINVSGEYGVYVSYQTYANSICDAHYEVIHSGDTTHFIVNQHMAGNSWVYLGNFYFKQGDNCSIRLSNYSALSKEGVVSGDAVRLGGGMGNIARAQQDPTTNDSINDCYEGNQAHVSGVARWMEGARYYLQWNGVPDSVYIYQAPEGKKYKPNDYTDDLTCRGKWVNFLSGGSAVNPHQKGAAVPLDLALALHTDAGVTPLDSIIGTLLIYSSHNDLKEKVYANGVSREVARELADCIQREVVNDIRSTFAPEWTRRALYDKSYSESRLPNIPAVIIELLSHQNYADMHYGHDPRFKFLVSRSIYKGILKYLHAQDSSLYYVHPLPVSDFQIQKSGTDELTLAWQPRIDTLEETAIAEKYLIQWRINDTGWNNGIVVDSNHYRIKVKLGEHYSFRVCALNKGGCSLPSETLSACLLPNPKGCALIVNGFNRLSGPQGFQIDSTYAGFYGEECGINYGKNIGYVGEQYEFRKNVSWSDDDAPGFGASYAHYEQILSMGNQQNYTGVHGQSFVEEGYSYVSCNASVLDSIYPCGYEIVDVILGAQGTHTLGLRKIAHLDSCYTHQLIDYLEKAANKGTHLLVSGSNVGSDLWNSNNKALRHRVQSLLHYSHMSDNATKTGHIQSTANQLHCFSKNGDTYRFYTEPNEHKYAVTHADGIVPYGQQACSVMRYKENQLSAAVAYQGDKYRCCIFGFPIECLTSQTKINTLLKEVIKFFEQSKNMDN